MGSCVSAESVESEPSVVIGLHDICEARINHLERTCHELRARQRLSDRNVRDLVVQLSRCTPARTDGPSMRQPVANTPPVATRPPLVMKPNGSGYTRVSRV